MKNEDEIFAEEIYNKIKKTTCPKCGSSFDHSRSRIGSPYYYCQSRAEMPIFSFFQSILCKCRVELQKVAPDSSVLNEY